MTGTALAFSAERGVGIHPGPVRGRRADTGHPGHTRRSSRLARPKCQPGLVEAPGRWTVAHHAWASCPRSPARGRGRVPVSRAGPSVRLRTEPFGPPVTVARLARRTAAHDLKRMMGNGCPPGGGLRLPLPWCSGHRVVGPRSFRAGWPDVGSGNDSCIFDPFSRVGSLTRARGIRRLRRGPRRRRGPGVSAGAGAYRRAARATRKTGNLAASRRRSRHSFGGRGSASRSITRPWPRSVLT